MISFTALGKYKVDGTIDAQNHVTRVETKIPNPVMGDTDVVATYSDYKDFSGVQFPTKILVEQGGFPAVGSDHHERHAECPARSPGAGRGGQRRPARRCRR